MKKGLLYSYYSQLDEWYKNHNIQLELFKGRIAEFKKQNDDHMNQLNKQIGLLQREYFVVIDDMIQMDGTELRLQEGKTRYSFDENWKMLMMQHVGTKFTSEHYDEPVTEEVKAEA